MIRFFVCKDIISLIEDKTNEIDTIINTINQENTKPFFIYTYSIFESTITEILRYYFNAFPEKMDKINNISKDDLLSTTMVNDIIIENINNYIRIYSSDTLYKYLTFCDKTLSIETNPSIELINKISSIRNTIIHDNAKTELLTKHIYNVSKTEFSVSNARKYIQALNNYLIELKEPIENKYNSYTLEKLLRDVWKHVFFSPLLAFDNIWKFNEDGSLQIQELELVKSKIEGISSSEHLLLSIFLQQYNNKLNQYFHSFQDLPSLVSLSTNTKDKLVDIISFFKFYPLLFTGEKIK